jgi:lysophospholipase L1-like esterase
MADGNKRSDKNNFALYAVISAAIVVIAVVFVMIAKNASDRAGDETSALSTKKGADVQTVEGSQTTGPETTDAAPVTEKQTESTADTEPATTKVEKIPINSEDYTGVAYSGEADISVMSKAVLIGDSRTKGLPLYTPIVSSGARVYANEGLSLANISTTAFVTVGENKVTALDALRADTDYDSVYISLGINEMGLDLAYIDSWIDRFAGLIETIREINPEAEIYIQAILPVSEEKSSSNEVFTKERIDVFNKNLLALAKREEVNFLNTDEMFVEYGGYLPAEGDAGDGLHVNKAYSEKWLEYMIEHRA